MNNEVERLFETALGVPRELRMDFLSSHCPNAEVRSEVEALLKYDDGSETFIGNAVGRAAESMVGGLSLPPGQRLGAYRIVSQIGSGGMGTVYQAERADGQFEQRVAVKVVQAGPDTAFVVERLQQERRILASLEHPNIARLLDAGRTEDGLPYFIMEYVAGAAIDKFCEERDLTTHERLGLFLPVCDAVQFAHQRLIVHRDLKPENILVTEQGIPKLLDFGIAKVLDQSATATQSAATRVLTPEYASPEQVRGEPVGTSTDVYSLGGVLYKLLTGASPHQLKTKSLVESVRAINEDEVRPPSELRRELAGDPEHILQMALRKEPQRRYRSVEQLAADIGRFLHGKPVLATPDTVWYRSGKFMRRHWLGVAAAAAIVIALGTGALIANWQARRAERRFAQVRHLANAFLFDFEQSIHDVPGTTKARQLLVRTALEYLQSLAQDASGDPLLAREVAAAYERVGDIQGEPTGGNVGDVAGSVQSYQKAISLRRALADPGSRDPKTRSDFANVLLKLVAVQQRTDNLDAAVRNCQEALSISDASHRADRNDRTATEGLARSYMEMAKLQQRVNQAEPALENARRGVELWESLAAADPRDRSLQEGLAYAEWRKGELFARLYRSPEAVPLYEKSLPIYEKLSSEDPGNARLRRQLMIVLISLSHERWGAAGRDRGSRPSAAVIAGFRRAYGIALQSVAADPANAEAVSDLVATSVTFGGALGVSGDHREAQSMLERAVESASSLVARDPGSRENRLNLAISQTWLATHFSANGDVSGALRYRHIAGAAFERLAAESPNDAKILEAQVSNWQQLGRLLTGLGDWAEARRNFALALQVAEQMSPTNSAFTPYVDDLRRATAKSANQP